MNRKTNLRLMVREELFPVVLENPLESEMPFADGFHNGLNPTSVPDSTTNYYCPEGASCSPISSWTNLVEKITLKITFANTLRNLNHMVYMV